MFVSPSQTLSLQVPGAPAQRTQQSVRGGDSAPTDEAAAPKIQLEAFTHSVSNVEYDSDARRIIFRQIHAGSGTVLSQFPNEAVLRIRDYVAADEAATGRLVAETA